MIFYKQFDLSLANLPKGIPFSPAFAFNTLTFCNGADRRQRRKQGGAVGAAASKDASGSEADAGSRNPGSVTEGDGEGKPVSIEYLHSDMHRPLSGLILSLCFLFLDDILALSGASRQLSQRESQDWH